MLLEQVQFSFLRFSFLFAKIQSCQNILFIKIMHCLKLIIPAGCKYKKHWANCAFRKICFLSFDHLLVALCIRKLFNHGSTRRFLIWNFCQFAVSSIFFAGIWVVSIDLFLLSKSCFSYDGYIRSIYCFLIVTLM